MTAIRTSDLSQVSGLPEGTVEDKALALSFQSGEAGAYRAIYDRYVVRIHGVCRRMLGCPEDAQEATQETLLRVYQGLHRFNGSYQLGAWITRIATNVCLDQLRARSRDLSDPIADEYLETGVPDELEPETATIRKSEGRRVRRVLDSLPPVHRAAIVLRDFEGLSYAEIAGVLDMTDSQVKALLQRARQGFKRSWMPAFIPLLWHGPRARKLIATKDVHTASTTPQVADIAATGSNFVASCSGVLQQCGQAMADRIVPIFTAAAVTLGAGSALSTPRPEEPPVQRTQGGQVPDGITSFSPAGSTRTADRGAEHPENPDGPRDSGVAESPPEEPVDPPPQQAPAPAPTTSPGEGGTGSQGVTPQPPAEPSEPSGFAFDLATDVAFDGTSCACIYDTRVESESVAADPKGMANYSQSLVGSASAGGARVYGLELQHAGTSSNQSVHFVLWTAEGAYHYDASSSDVTRVATEWGGWTYRYTGSYELVGRPTHSENVPEVGAYVSEVTVSWRRQLVVSSNFLLTEAVD